MSALFIAVCSAFFSVRGLGMLFIGSATAVMIMAASLEVGKLVAASFLYRYWNEIGRAFKIYLTAAVVLLIAITSLGNYGYLARAYERTHTQISLLEDQITCLQKEITDTQRQIDNSNNRLGKVTDAGREDLANLQARITQANTSFDQSLARLQEQRKTAQDRRDHDTATATGRLTEQADVLKKAIASEDAAIDGLTQQLAVLDRAVDAYTKQGGPGLFKTDGVKRGQELREQQRAERDAIAAKIAGHRTQQEQLRADHTKSIEASDRAIADARDAFAKQTAQLDTDEQTLRKTQTDSLALAQQQLALLQTKGQTLRTEGDTQIESLYQRIRARTEDIRHLQERIAATDIGSYRFVARAFEAPADSVVKWLILALVLVFDPLAVSLAVGFNVALLQEYKKRRTATPATTASAPLVTETISANSPAPAGTTSPSRAKKWITLGTGLFLLALIVAGIAVASYYGINRLQRQSLNAHAALVPADSFAVVTMRPSELANSAQAASLGEWFQKTTGTLSAPLLAAIASGGFDPRANIYLFAKFPTRHNATTAANTEHPVILCGIIARLADAAAAENALSAVTEKISANLRGSSTLSRNRSMIRSGNGRYMDPEGGFFSFALAGKAAVLLAEFEGDPKSPCVEQEIQACLAPRDDTTDRATLSPRALGADGALSVWLDADRFFRAIPKNPAAQARYQQLQRHLGFDLLLKLKPTGSDRLNLVADYAYQVDRFNDHQLPSPVEKLAALGANDTAGVAGRLMDRCTDTLDYDSLIERLRASFGDTEKAGVKAVVVEKNFATARDAQFTLTARTDPGNKPPLMAAVQTLWK